MKSLKNYTESGVFTIVSCKDKSNPNFQIWGAMSDLKCKKKNKSFKEWLLVCERQMMMFSTKEIELYHGTNTGIDNSVLNNFKVKGINPETAYGYGQGSGFYVWSDKNSAIRHADDIINDRITTKSKQDGLPMVITIETIADPEKWDLDYEANYSVLIDWLYDNFDKVQSFVSDNDVGLHAKRHMNVLNHKDQWVPSKGITFRDGNSTSSRYSQSWSQSDIRLGRMIGSIMNKIQQKDPRIIHKFEELFFANMSPGAAIKYVGSNTLIPKKIEVFKDGKWNEV